MPRQTPFGDIRKPWLLYVKAALLLSISILAAVILLMDQPTLRTAGLLAIAIWAACRAYYFAFYVIEHYADPKFRYSGLLSLLRCVLRSRHAPDGKKADDR